MLRGDGGQLSNGTAELQPLAPGTYAAFHPHATGYWESCTLEPSGLLRLTGWGRELPPPPQVFANDASLSPLNVYRTYRPEIASQTQTAFAGMAFEYRLPYETTLTAVVVESATGRLWSATGELRLSSPAYAHLLTGDRVLGRDGIYGEGMPVPVVSEVVLSLMEGLPEPLLDFGCGMGAMVRALRSRGTAAFGIEIDRPAIRQTLLPEVRDFVKLYDGSFPLPYGDDELASVTSVEVIEHIPDYNRALAELARVTGDRAAFTVPNIDAIPLCFPHQVVPWHLLEATHLNFFNPRSFEATLRQHFARVELCQIHPVSVNGTQFHTSLAAQCWKSGE